MEGNTGGIHSSLDPEHSTRPAKRRRKSCDKPPKSREEIICLEDNSFVKLKFELDILTKALESLKVRYQNLQSFFPTDNTLQMVDKSYSTRMKHVNNFKKKEGDMRKRATELKKESVALKRKTVTKASMIKKIEKLTIQIQKEIKYLEKLDKTIKEKITIQERKYNKEKKRIKRQTVKGDEFQRILQVLLRQRAQSCAGAEVGIEVSGVGQLDDVVYAKITENKCRFFQIKHRTNKLSCVTAAELFKCNFEDDEDDDHGEANTLLNQTHGKVKKKVKEQPGLHLLMYFKSFCNIKENSKFKNCNIEEVTLITNRDIDLKSKVIELKTRDTNLKSYLEERKDSEKDECLDFEGKHARKAQKYGLNVNIVKKEYSDFLKKESYKYLIKNKNLADNIIEEFLEKIHIVVNYPDLQDLRNRTFNEVFHEDIFASSNRKILEAYMLKTEIELLDVSNEFTTNVEWQSKINEVKKFINKLKSIAIRDSIINGLKLDMEFNMDFKTLQDLNEDLNQLIDMDRFQILECMSNNVKLNTMKIIQILKGKKYLLCKYDHLLTADFIIKTYFEEEFCLLVVMCKRTSIIQSELWNNLAKSLNEDPSKKMIIVSEVENSFTSSMKDKLKEKYLSNTYKHGYEYLTEHCKETLNNKPIIFQTQKLAFGQLISNNLANVVVDENCLYNIVDRSNPDFKVSDDSSFCSLGYNGEYYIQREFYQKTISFTKLNQYLLTNVFFITGTNEMTESQIKTVLRSNRISEEFVQKWDGQANCKSGILLGCHNTLSNGQIFHYISSSTHTRFHWLSMNVFNDLFLIDSTEENFADNELIDKASKKENNLNTNDLGRIVILVGDSGVGKSTTLTSIANKIRQASPITWVARVILRKPFVLRSLQNTTKLISSDDAIACVTNMIFTSEPQNVFDKNLITEGLKHFYKDKFSFVLLLDGFNEINEALQDKVITLIKILRNECNVDQIWITTQNYVRVKLETELEVSAYFLEPLNGNNQIHLMARYWQTKMKKRNSTVTYNYWELHKEAQSEINLFKSFVNGVEKRLFTENSLNLRMLADIVFIKRNINYKLALFDIYEVFVRLKFSVYKRETTHDQGEISIDSTKDKIFENSVRCVLQQFSVQTVLNNHKNNKGIVQKLPGMDAYETVKTCSESELALSKLGLLILKKHKYDFIHPSFLQFFFCEYYLKNKHDYNLSTFLMQVVLSSDSFQLCQLFLNQALGKLDKSNPRQLQKVTRYIPSKGNM